MRCPYCHLDNVKVGNTRYIADGFVVRRRRTCLSCGKKFTTHERVETTRIWVVKRNSPREPFDSKKLQVGLEHACRKRPITDEQITELITQVEQDINSSFENEVESQFIGESVLHYLSQLDQVAYVRFASVYKDFKGAADFVQEMQKLMQNPDMPSLASEYIPKKRPSRFPGEGHSRYNEQGLLGEED